jgi:hypothetical protein
MVLVIESPLGRLHSLHIHTPLVTKTIDVGVTRVPDDLHTIMIRVKAEVYDGQNLSRASLSTLQFIQEIII